MQTIFIPEPLPAGGFRVDVAATFTGIRNIPLWTLSHNSATPSLVLHEEHFEYRVIRKKERRYSEVANVSPLVTIGTALIDINFTNSLFNFSGNLYEELNLVESLAFFRRKRVRLSPGAAKLLSKHGS